MLRQVCLVSFVGPKKNHESSQEVKTSLEEMEELLKVLDLKVKKVFIQTLKELSPSTLIGEGKLQEIAHFCSQEGISQVIFDTELSPGQGVRLTEILKRDVLDRTMIILDIFFKQSQDEFSKTQVQIAQEEYLLPRLAGRWTHLSRQKGGIGLKGEGEKQLEVDRRLSRKKIFRLKEKLKILEKRYQEQSKKRQENLLTATLVGRTNAGKSSLLNSLCLDEQLTSSSYFSTLDARFRLLTPSTKPLLCLADTVGFIQKLPTQLITGFKTTMLAAQEGKVLILVLDSSDLHYKEHLDLMLKSLEQLGFKDKKILLVFNKIDLLTDGQLKLLKRLYPQAFFVSSLVKESVLSLRKKLIQFLLDHLPKIALFIPYEEGKNHMRILSESHVLRKNLLEDGIYYEVKIEKNLLRKTGLEKFQLDKKSTYLVQQKTLASEKKFF